MCSYPSSVSAVARGGWLAGRTDSSGECMKGATGCWQAGADAKWDPNSQASLMAVRLRNEFSAVLHSQEQVYNGVRRTTNPVDCWHGLCVNAVCLQRGCDAVAASLSRNCCATAMHRHLRSSDSSWPSRATAVCIPGWPRKWMDRLCRAKSRTKASK